MKISFKKELSPGGLAAISWNPSTKIKLGGKEIGYIQCKYQPTENWKIHLAIKKQQGNCQFSWISFKATFENEQDARAFIKENFHKIQKKYQIHQFDH